ncbi:hypothetical protein [Flavobacterium salmonis]|uniref:Uncharacterized protein n=2 Tax=Flavobacterium TaxID=237 RepID=A0A6V6Z9J7_9FLAO|nr:hypothetical protein [Flavobacterium salmonis]CAD0008461.1 hypothetical protein FLAT13_04399 [Flavobacterium salmonis]
MNVFSLFKKRNYIYFYHRLKPYSRSVRKGMLDYSDYESLNNLSDYFRISDFKKIVVVASGPSAKKIVLEKDALYFCCNDSINIVKTMPHIYVVHDPFYLIKYLKSFVPTDKWMGTTFWIMDNKSKINSNSFEKVLYYILRKHRNKREFLITNYKYNKSSEFLYKELIESLKEDFGFTYQSINSGFNTLMLGAILALKKNKPLEVYGLDMGIGGNQYYNKSASIGKSISGDNNKEIVKDFLNQLYKQKIKIYNASNFMNYESK